MNPTEEGRLAAIAGLKQQFPAANSHEAAVEQLGGKLTWATPSPRGDSPSFWMALIRFGPKVARQFGWSKELLAVYAPFSDVQSRTFEAAWKHLNDTPRAVTSDVAFLWAPDAELENKLGEWSRAYKTLVPLPTLPPDSAVAARRLLRIMRERLFTRDLYYETHPVTDEQFFGRRTLMGNLRRDLEDRRPIGIFGLRKTGKTSILQQVKNERQRERRYPTVIPIQDLERLPPPPADPIPILTKLLKNTLAEEFRHRGMGELAAPLERCEPNLDDFGIALSAALREPAAERAEVILVLDEIEYLLRSAGARTNEQVLATQCGHLFGVLRAIAQETRSFNFIISGMTSAPLEEGTIGGRPNPLFNWAKPYFVSFFDDVEANELVTVLGRRMGTAWTRDAIDMLLAETSGHPFLLRSLCSNVVQSLPLQVEERSVDAGTVRKLRDQWIRDQQGSFREIVSHLERYYPTEHFLLVRLIEEPEHFSEWVTGEASEMTHLLELGVVRQRKDGGYAASVLARRGLQF